MKQRDYILSLIAQGEHVHQDFKYQISDARKIARSISAFANNSGGHLLIGVKDNGNIAGVKSDEEIYMIEQAADMYCKPAQKVTFAIYKVEGKTVVKADIAESEQKPVKAPDEKGEWKAYYRVADENIMTTSLHAKMLAHDSDHDSASSIINFSQREQLLVDYLSNHGGITVSGIARLLHCSRAGAETLALSLHDMGIVDVDYHAGKALLVLRDIN